MRLLTTSLFFLLCLSLGAQPLIYDAPLRGPLLITGTFGELRSNHFHAGLDFRAAVNTPVYNVADGFVSRITVNAGGYGQAIYIDHPDGKRSLYGHLETLSPALLDTVRSRQFASEEFTQDLRFDSTAFPLQRGAVIGGVGNRGHSFGPHLHFEIRDTNGDAPLNPFSLGFPIPDTRAPQIRNLRVYELDDKGLEIKAQTFSLSPSSADTYTVADTIFVTSSRVGLALKAYDRQNALPNWNGIYAGTLYADTTLVHQFAFDRIPYEQTEYLNAMTDYADWIANSSWYHLFWALTQDAMFCSQKAMTGNYDGSLRLVANRPLSAKMQVLDYSGNVAEVTFNIVYRPGKAVAPKPPHQYFLPAGEASIIDNGALRLELTPKSLYRDCFFQYARLPDTSAGHLSDVFQVHSHLTPLHGRAKLTLRANYSVPPELRDHVFLGSCNDNGSWSSAGGEWLNEDHFQANISTFGDYALFLDTIPPTVSISSFPTDLRRSSGFSLLVKDNVRGGGMHYRATIDGKWILLEYDSKNNQLNYSFKDGDPGPGEHLFVLEATDGQNNHTKWERRFRR